MSDHPWYRSTPDAAAIPPHVAERAAEWLLDLQSDPASPQRVDEWRRWRDAHPDHERAWQRIEAVRGKLRGLSSPLSSFPSTVAQAVLMQPDMQPGMRPDSPQRRRAVRALALLVCAGAAAWGVDEYVPVREWTADFRTAIGERRTLTLDDGTRVVLNTDSALDVRFGDTGRRLRLVAGEILITTAADAHTPPRPFLVETAQGTARALGTEYAVRQEDGRTAVCVMKGAVEIRPRRHVERAVVLHAGYRADYTAQDVAPMQPASDDDIAWMNGFIVARSMRLADFIAELSRYSSESLSCDADIAGLRVSGSYPVADIRKVLDALSITLDVRIERVTRFWGVKSLHVMRRT